MNFNKKKKRISAKIFYDKQPSFIPIFYLGYSFYLDIPQIALFAGAKVRVECRMRATNVKTCDFDGVTDSTGTYNILVADEHENEICESVLVSSPDSACSVPVMGREKARVFLTRNNGIASNKRVANAMGFRKEMPLAWCAGLMKMYEEVEV